MKKNYALLIGALLLSICIQAQSKTRKYKMAMDIIDAVTLEKVVEVNADKEVILSKLTEWVPNNMNREGLDSIEMKIEGYNIKGKGSILLSWTGLFNGSFDFYFDYSFDIKDNKLRFKIFNIYRITAYTQNVDNKPVDTGMKKKDYITGNKGLKQISKCLAQKRIIENLKAFIEGNVNKDDEW